MRLKFGCILFEKIRVQLTYNDYVVFKWISWIVCIVIVDMSFVMARCLIKFLSKRLVVLIIEMKLMVYKWIWGVVK